MRHHRGGMAAIVRCDLCSDRSLLFDPDPGALNQRSPRRRQPIVTGTSVLGMKFDGGVLMVADMLGAAHLRLCAALLGATLTATLPGQTLRQHGALQDRGAAQAVGEHTCVGAGGDLSDFQYIVDLLDERSRHLFLGPQKHVLGCLRRSPRAFPSRSEDDAIEQMVTSWAQNSRLPVPCDVQPAITGPLWNCWWLRFGTRGDALPSPRASPPPPHILGCSVPAASWPPST